jgi:hypothetical protein
VGQFRINPRDLPDGKLVDDWYPVKPRPGKKDGVTGDIQERTGEKGKREEEEEGGA